MIARAFRSTTRVAMAVLSAVLIVCAFPPHAMRLLAWFALVPLLLALRTSTYRGAAGLAALWGMIGAYGVTHWLPPAVSVYYNQPFWLGLTLFSVAAFVMGAVEYAAFGVFYRWAVERRVRALPLLAGAAWAACEMGRARLFTGNPWGLLGYTQAGSSITDSAFGLNAGIAPATLIQVADLGGVYAITFVIVTVNVALAEVWSALRSGRRARSRAAWSDGALAFSLVAAAWGYGVARTATFDRLPPKQTAIAVVQGNLDLGSQWREDLYGRNLDTYLGLTHDAARDAHPRLVFWPENAMTFFVDAEPVYRAAIASVTRPSDVELVAGAPRYEHASDPVYFNSAFVLGPAGDVEAVYDKERLLPFAEYFPFGAVSLLRRTFARVREFTPGAHDAALPTRAGLAGMTICNEAMFPELVRRRVLAGAEYLVNLSNDSWIADMDFGEHQLALISLRAAEQRRWLVRASTSGPSAIVDPLGRVTARTEPGRAAVLRASVASRSDLTLYARYGDAFAWLCLAAAVATLVIVEARERQYGRRRGR